MHKCSRCNKEIGSQESYLVYGKDKYCKECIVYFVFKREALPNDGSVRGGALALELSKKKVAPPKEELKEEIKRHYKFYGYEKQGYLKEILEKNLGCKFKLDGE